MGGENQQQEPQFVTVKEFTSLKDMLHAHTELESLKEGLRAQAELAAERDRRYEERFNAMDTKTQLALTASKEAVNKAEIATEKRFDSVNEFRGTLSDQARTLLPRMEGEAKFIALEEKISVANGALEGKIEQQRLELVKLRDSQSMAVGKEGAADKYQLRSQWTFDKVLGLIAICISLISIALLVIRTSGGAGIHT
jgi:hypothetical protein